MFDNKWQRKEMPLVSLTGMSGGIASPAFLSSLKKIVLDILSPSIFSPVQDAGRPSYTVQSSAITSIADGGSVSGRVDVGNRSLFQIKYGGGKFVAVSDGGDTTYQVVHFDDPTGTIGYATGTETGNYWRGVAYGVPSTGTYQNQGMWVATSQIGGTNKIMYSVDGGSTWNGASPAVSSGSWWAIGYGDGKFVAVGYNGETNNHVLYSTDGITWTPANDTGTTADPGATSNYWNGVAYGNGKFVAVSYYGSSSRIMHSTDGSNWTTLTDADVPWDSSTHGWWKVIYGGGKFVAITQESRAGIQPAAVSSDGVNWQLSNVTPYDTNRRWSDITYGNGMYVAICGINSAASNGIFYSTDGIDWQKSSTPEAITWNGIAYGNGKFVAVASTGSYLNGRVAWSEDGITWTGTVTDITLTDTTAYSDGTLLAGESFVDFLSPGKKLYSGESTSYWIHRLLSPKYNKASTKLWTKLPITTDSSGNVIYAGSSDKSGFPALITKYDSAFNRLWQQTFNVTAGFDTFTAAVCDSSDNIYAVGDTYVVTGYSGGKMTYTAGAGKNEMMLVKFDSSGNLQWQTGLGGLGSSAGGVNASSVKLDNSGNIYATGYTKPNNSVSGHPMDIWIAKWNSSGTLQWKRQLGGSVYSGGFQGLMGNDLAVNKATGDCYVVSDTWVVAKWNTSGSLQWQKRPSMSDSTYSQASSFNAYGIAIDSSGNIYTTGADRQFYSSSYTKWTAPLIKMDPNGNIIWYKVQSGNGWRDNMYGYRVAVDSADNVITVGYGKDYSEYNGNAIRISKYDTSGTRQWINRFGTTTSDYDNTCGLAIDIDNNIIFTDHNSDGAIIAKLPGDGSHPGTGVYDDTFASDSSSLPWYSTVGYARGIDDISYSTSTYLTSFTTVSSHSNSNTSFSEFAGLMSAVTPYGTATSYGPEHSNPYIYDSPGYGILGPGQGDQTPIFTETSEISASVSSVAGNIVTVANTKGAFAAGSAFSYDIVYPDAVSATDALLSSGSPSLSPTSDPWPNDIVQWDVAMWEVATDENFTQNVQTQTVALSATGIQAGPSFTLEANTGYYTRTKYTALGQESEWSDVVYFITAA